MKQHSAPCQAPWYCRRGVLQAVLLPGAECEVAIPVQCCAAGCGSCHCTQAMAMLQSDSSRMLPHPERVPLGNHRIPVRRQVAPPLRLRPYRRQLR
jgi:hypothetical protein